MKRLLPLILLLIAVQLNGQELYVFSEPASNVPAHSLSVKLTNHLVSRDMIYGRVTNRLMPQAYLGLSKKVMLALGGTFANMHTPNFRPESVNLYAKYRFLSKDELHKHFRMAVFAEASSTRAPFHYDEITLMGDKTGVELGLIATQLWHKLAVSGTVSHTQVLDESRNNKILYVPARNYQSMNYSVSAGYLVLPKEYIDYRQTNLNIYTELLAQQTLDRRTYFVDIATALQLIFNSNTKLNLGYRTQLGGTMQRMTTQSWLISFERTFLGVLKKKKN
ncbi:MAG TPA: hypothetical protein VFV31_08220 [Chitinophagaceae bacterium]|nr:hypothetical protein [Chitinophagaceae bacterium]